MDALRRPYDWLADRLGEMPPSRRLALLTVPAVLVTALAVLLWRGGTGGDRVPVSWGKVFTTDELRTAEQTLLDAGLTEFRAEGQRLYAPASDVEQYNAVLLAENRLPGEALSEFEKQFEKSSIFTSREQLGALRDIARRKELRAVLRAVPDIADASVFWAESRTGRWPERGTRMKATVNLMPTPGTALATGRIESIRRAVANMLPDLTPEDVTVFDQSTGTAHAADAETAADDRLLRVAESHRRRYTATIERALSYIPGVLVGVHVRLEDLQRRVERSQTVDSKQTVTLSSDESTRNRTSVDRPPGGEPGVSSNRPQSVAPQSAGLTQTTDESTESSTRVAPSWKVVEQELLAASPTAIRVDVSIPEDYHRRLAASRGTTPPEGGADRAEYDAALAAIRTEEERKAVEKVRTLIGAAVNADGSPADPAAVSVSTVTPIEPDVTPPAEPFASTAGRLLREWGGTAVLAAVVLCGMVLLGRRAAPPLPDAADEENPLAAVGPDGAKKSDDGPPAEPTERDRLQEFVRDNPEATAMVLSRWIQQAA